MEGRTEGARVGIALVAGVAGGLAALAVHYALKKLHLYMQKPRELKIVYFPFAGKAGSIRAACKLAKVPCNNKIVHLDEFLAMKPNLPFGQVPVVELNSDGNQICQSRAILRYLGKLAGLYPADPLRALKVDEFVDSCEDVVEPLRRMLRERDRRKKAKIQAEIFAPDSQFRKQVANLEKLMVRHGGPYAVGKSMTIADLALFHRLERALDEQFGEEALVTRTTLGLDEEDQSGGADSFPDAMVPPDFLSDYPVFAKHAEKMATHFKSL